MQNILNYLFIVLFNYSTILLQVCIYWVDALTENNVCQIVQPLLVQQIIVNADYETERLKLYTIVLCS